MITKLEDILVVSDLDGTLLTDVKGIPSCNIETIKLFTSLGGKFTIATGRNVESARNVVAKLSVTLPVVAYNGGVIYDYVQNKSLCYCTLNQNSAKLAVQDIMEKFPTVGVEIMADDFNTYLINANQQTHNHLSREKINYITTSLSDTPDGWFKV